MSAMAISPASESLADEYAAQPAAVDGLVELLAECRLSEQAPAAATWCQEQGTDSIEELVELGFGEEFVDALAMKPVQRARLKKRLGQLKHRGPVQEARAHWLPLAQQEGNMQEGKAQPAAPEPHALRSLRPNYRADIGVCKCLFSPPCSLLYVPASRIPPFSQWQTACERSLLLQWSSTTWITAGCRGGLWASMSSSSSRATSSRTHWSLAVYPRRPPARALSFSHSTRGDASDSRLP